MDWRATTSGNGRALVVDLRAALGGRASYFRGVLG